MPRRSHGRALSIWANGEPVGEWRIPARGPTELVYDRRWLASPAGRPLSLSLPFGLGDTPLVGPVVEHWFDNLLPDHDAIRRRIASRFRAESLAAFDLLAAIGRDCVGAVQLLPAGETPRVDRIDGTPLTEADVEAMLGRVSTVERWQGDPDDLRISLAGAQEKTALLWHDGRWLRPHGATPTTHIFKLPLGLVGHRRVDFTTSIENEWLCLAALRAYGLPVPDAALLRFGAARVLAVERFDRRLHSSGRWWLRLPQEDLCQAYGLPTRAKYEVDGGPGWDALVDVARGSIDARADLDRLARTQVLFWMLAAPDGHAKNFSLHLLPGGAYRATPLYDVMSIWPVEGNGPNQWSWHRARMAMALRAKNRHDRFADVVPHHFDATARRCGHSAGARPLLDELVARTPQVIEALGATLPPGFPARVADRIFAGLRRSARTLEHG